jgi:hypothetical protein
VEDLLQFLDEAMKERVAKGEVSVHPGQDPEKPVLRDAKKGHLVKGTGLTPEHNDMGTVSKNFAYKRTNAYDAFLEKKLNPEKLDPNDPESLEWWWKAAQFAASPTPIEVNCPKCQHAFETKAGKPDGNLIYRIMERVIGKAVQRQEVNIKQEEVLQILNEGVPIDTLIVHQRTPEDIENRRKTIELELD